MKRESIEERVRSFLLPVAVTVPIVAYAYARSHSLADRDSFDALVFLLVPFIIGISSFMFRFLEDKRDRYRSSDVDRSELKALKHSLLEYRRSVEELTSKDKESLVAQLHQEVKKKATDAFLGDIRTSLLQRDRAAEWEKHFSETSERIDAEIAAQGRRGTLNLILGVVTALAGIILLSWVVLGDAQGHASVNDFVMSFIPRVSIVAIVEVFAYFFLRLYKASLAEIKYFQNEATNLEVRFAALRIALDSEDAALRATVVGHLLTMERNPLMDKEKTTLELEKEKLDLNAVTISLPQVLTIVKDVVARSNTK